MAGDGLDDAFLDKPDDLKVEGHRAIAGLSDPALREIAISSEVPYDALKNFRDNQKIADRYLPILCNYLRSRCSGGKHGRN